MFGACQRASTQHTGWMTRRPPCDDMLPSLSADFDPLSGRLFGPGATVCTTLYYYTTVGYGSMFIFSFCSKESFSPHIRNYGKFFLFIR
jgi:hypothetical protein